MIKTIALISVAVVSTQVNTAYADKLDDIISSGTLRCAVSLDIPPIGFRDDQNNPAGFDVDYCRDLAKVLGVQVELVETPLPDRIPALMTGRADVGIASVSDTLERAKTIGFSVPYFVYKPQVVAMKASGFKSFDDLKGKRLGAVAGTYEAINIQNAIAGWKDSSTSFRGYQLQSDVLLALQQGQIDATVLVSTEAEHAMHSGKFPDFVVVADAPFVADYAAMIAPRTEQGLLNYLNLFIHQQVRTGRYAELYKKWMGSDSPADLTVKGVYR